MDSAGSQSQNRKLAAFTLPMVVQVIFLGVASILPKIGDNFWLSSPEYWIYPAQTICCGSLLVWFWREYEFRSAHQILFPIAIGLLVFAVWIAPQVVLGFSPRHIGFNPEIFSEQPAIYWAEVGFRFVRLVLVVPLIEEIFLRGFLLRYFINQEFSVIPIGTFSWLSFILVIIGFGMAHSPPDWIPALFAGALYNATAYRTKSLASCVLAHAITNLLLGIWIMKTGQWGFW